MGPGSRWWASRHRWIALGLVVFLLMPAMAGAVTCADFATQPEAQRYFDDRGGDRDSNIDDLDDDHDGIPCEHLPGGLGEVAETGVLARLWVPLLVGAAVIAGGAAAVWLLRMRRPSTPSPAPSLPVVQPLSPPDPELLGDWPETSAARRHEFEAMGADGPAAYLASPEWLDKEAWKERRPGGACELCGTQGPLTLHLRTPEHRFREQPSDVIVLCRSCSMTLS